MGPEKSYQEVERQSNDSTEDDAGRTNQEAKQQDSGDTEDDNGRAEIF